MPSPTQNLPWAPDCNLSYHGFSIPSSVMPSPTIPSFISSWLASVLFSNTLHMSQTHNFVLPQISNTSLLSFLCVSQMSLFPRSLLWPSIQGSAPPFFSTLFLHFIFLCRAHHHVAIYIFVCPPPQVGWELPVARSSIAHGYSPSP